MAGIRYRNNWKLKSFTNEEHYVYIWRIKTELYRKKLNKVFWDIVE